MQHSRTTGFVIRREARGGGYFGLGAWTIDPENRAVLTLVHLDGDSVREAADYWDGVSSMSRYERIEHDGNCAKY